MSRTGKVLEIPMINLEKKSGKIIFDNNGKKLKHLYIMEL